MANISNINNSWIFDYLNNNRHKFDEYGNFDASPDERDFVPPAMVTHPKGGYPRRPKVKKPRYSGLYPKYQGPDDVAQERNRYEAEDFARGIRYDSEKCHDNWELEKKLCSDGKYDSGCWERARERFMKCKSLGHYDGLPIWTYQDEVGQPQGAEDPDRSAKDKIRKTDPKPNANPKPGDNPDESKRVVSVGEAFLRANPLLQAYLAVNPFAARALHDGFAQFSALPSELVLMPSDYPKEMRPLSPYSPPPYLYPALGALMGPAGGPAAIGARLRALAPR